MHLPPSSSWFFIFVQYFKLGFYCCFFPGLDQWDKMYKCQRWSRAWKGVLWRMPTRPHAKEAHGPGQETNWFIHVMTFLVTQEVSLMAFVNFHNSLSSLGNAILAFRARKQWYLSLNESGPHSLWMWAILRTSGIHLFNHKLSVKKERIRRRKWYSRPAHVSWLGIRSKEIENDCESGESYCWLYNEKGSKARQRGPPLPWHVIPHSKDSPANLLHSV